MLQLVIWAIKSIELYFADFYAGVRMVNDIYAYCILAVGCLMLFGILYCQRLYLRRAPELSTE